jgi:hypothetical protein
MSDIFDFGTPWQHRDPDTPLAAKRLNERENAIVDEINAQRGRLRSLEESGGGGGVWKTPVADTPSLPATGNTLGDIRLVESDFTLHAWNGAEWLAIGGGASSGGGVATSTPVIETTIAELNALYTSPPADGTEGLITIGTGLDETFVYLTYDAARAKWVSDDFISIRCTDQNGPTIGFYARTQLGRSPVDGTALPTNYSWWSTATPRRVNAMISAGLGIEYRHHGWMIKEPGGVKGNTGAYLYNMAAGDPISSGVYNQPPTGGVARTPLADDLHEGGPNNTADYQWAAHAWQPLEMLGSITKTALHPIMVGHLDNDPAVTGSAAVIDYTLILRFVG